MRRSILALLLAAILLLFAAPSASAAGAVFVVNIPVQSVTEGEYFEVTVSLRDNPGFYALQFTLGYDQDVLECLEVIEGPLVKGMLSVTNPSASRGAIVTGASISEIRGDDLVATFAFVALKDAASLSFKAVEKDIASEEGDWLGVEVIWIGPEQPEAGEGSETGEPDEGGQGSEGSETGEPDEGGQGNEGSETGEPDEGGQGTGGSETGESDEGEQGAGGGTGEAQTGEPEDSGDGDPAQQTGEGSGDPAKPEPSFSDIAGHWGEGSILEAARRGLFNGYPDGRFGPDDNVTRAQFVTVLYRMSGSPKTSAQTPFADIGNLSAEFRSAIAWAYEKGYVNGKSETVFDPSGDITRQEAMKILFYYSGGRSGEEVLYYTIYDEGYVDSGSIASWAKPAMYWGRYNKIISGTSENTLSPEGKATRAQLARILVNYLDTFK